MIKVKQDKGITLIALIITIIVMMILTGVIVWQSVAEDGLIRKVFTTTQKYNETVAQEEINTVLSEWTLEKYTDNEVTLKSFLEEKGYTVIDLGEDEYKVSKNGYDFKVDKDLMVSSMGNDSDSKDDEEAIDRKEMLESIEIGDYVEYNPTIINKNGDKVEEIKLSYMSPKGTIPTSSSDNITHGNGSDSQTFTADANVKWRVLNVNKQTGVIELISADTIKSTSNSNLTIDGGIGYLYVEQELAEICKIYGYGYGADTSLNQTYTIGGPYDISTGEISSTGARSISIDDINKLAGITKDEYTTLDSNYGSTVTVTTSRYYPVLNSTNQTYPGQSSTSKEKFIYNYCSYNLLSKIEEQNIHSLLISTGNYLLSSRCTAVTPSILNFGIYVISSDNDKIGVAGLVNGGTANLTYKSQSDFGIRPIVTLKSDVLLKQSTEKENTWIIE